MSDYCLVNGQATTGIPINDRGLAYGDGLFETIKIVSRIPQFLDQHLRRLEQGCRKLEIELDTSLLKAELDQLLDQWPESSGVLKITVTREFGGRGYRYTKPSGGNRYLQLQPFDEAGIQRWRGGVKLRICHHRLPLNPPLAGLKHLNRLDNVMARAEWSDDAFDEGLMLDARGRVVEGTLSNFFLVLEDTLVTPNLHACGVAGVIRQFVRDKLAPAQGRAVIVRDVDAVELERCSEWFICNSLIGICPVLAIDDLKRPPGAVTASLQKALEEIE